MHPRVLLAIPATAFAVAVASLVMGVIAAAQWAPAARLCLGMRLLVIFELVFAICAFLSTARCGVQFWRGFKRLGFAYEKRSLQLGGAHADHIGSAAAGAGGPGHTSASSATSTLLGAGEARSDATDHSDSCASSSCLTCVSAFPMLPGDVERCFGSDRVPPLSRARCARTCVWFYYVCCSLSLLALLAVPSTLVALHTVASASVEVESLSDLTPFASQLDDPAAASITFTDIDPALAEAAGIPEEQRVSGGAVRIRARTEHDTLFLQGLAHASRRLLQMDLQRRAARGRLSEVAGPSTFDADAGMRTLGFENLTRRAVDEQMDARSLALVNAYAAGVNAFIRTRGQANLPLEYHLLGAEAAEFDAVDAVVFGRLMAESLAANAGSELRRLRYVLTQGISPQRLEQLWPPYNTSQWPTALSAQSIGLGLTNTTHGDARVPYLPPVHAASLDPTTMYTAQSARADEEQAVPPHVHAAVLEVVNRVRQRKGLPPVSQQQEQPHGHSEFTSTHAHAAVTAASASGSSSSGSSSSSSKDNHASSSWRIPSLSLPSFLAAPLASITHPFTTTYTMAHTTTAAVRTLALDIATATTLRGAMVRAGMRVVLVATHAGQWMAQATGAGESACGAVDSHARASSSSSSSTTTATTASSGQPRSSGMYAYANSLRTHMHAHAPAHAPKSVPGSDSTSTPTSPHGPTATSTSWLTTPLADVVGASLSASLSVITSSIMAFDKQASNNWVVHGSSTSTGKPVLANDPHLGLTIPGIWIVNSIHATDTNMGGVGVSFAGVPGIVLGRNRWGLAWGATTTGADEQDIFVLDESADGSSFMHRGAWVPYEVRDEEVRVRGEDTPRRVRVRYAPMYGPVVSDNEAMSVLGGDGEEDDGGTSPLEALRVPLALSWSMTDKRAIDGTVAAILGLHDARTWGDFREAFSQYLSPSQSYIFASSNGDIGYQMPAVVPVRVAGHSGAFPVPGNGSFDWLGHVPYDELPRTLNPVEGHVATANARITPRDGYPYYITRDWNSGSEGYRAQRVEQALAVVLAKGTAESTPAAIGSVQRDVRSLGLLDLVSAARTAVGDGTSLSASARGLHAELAAWDGEMSTGSRLATVAAVLVAHAMRLAEREVDEVWRNAVFARSIFLNAARHTAPGDAGVDPLCVRAGFRTCADAVRTMWEDTAKEVHATSSDAAKKGNSGGSASYASAAPRWGKDVHRLVYRSNSLHATPLRCLADRADDRPGDGFTPDAAPYAPSDKYETRHGPSYRGVIDLSDVLSPGAIGRSGYVSTPGVSGNVMSPLYDNMRALWSKGLLMDMTVPK